MHIRTAMKTSEVVWLDHEVRWKCHAASTAGSGNGVGTEASADGDSGIKDPVVCSTQSSGLQPQFVHVVVVVVEFSPV